MDMHIIIQLLLIVPPVITTELYGYDCQQQGVSTKVISLTEVEECKTHNVDIHSEVEWGQIIQLSTINNVKTYTCRIMRSSWVYRCGMHSHQMLVGGPTLNEPIHITKDECESIFQFNKWEATRKIIIEGIKPNITTQATVTEEGSLDTDGTCNGVTLHYKGATYANSFLRSSFEILITTQLSSVDTSSNQIFLRDSLTCPHDTGHCYDNLVGLSYWTPYAADCGKQYPLLLHEGQLTLLYEKTTPSLVKVKDNKFMFTSKLNGQSIMCNRQIFTTDYQNIIVLVSTPNNPKLQASVPTNNQLNPVLYANAKISYLHYQTVQDIKDVYFDVLRQLCEIERKVIMNTLDLIRLTPQSTKYVEGLKQKGSIIHVKGEVAYITQCPISKVTLRYSDSCYNGLPVTLNNTDMFLLPVSRMIIPNASEITCTAIAPAVYYINNQWVAVTPQYVRAHPPHVMGPKTKINQDPTVIKGFAEGGIYSSHDLEQFYASLTHGPTRDAVVENIIQGIITQSPAKYNILHTINPEGWAYMAKQHMKALWGHFTIFGEFVSGLLGLYVIYVIVSRLVQIIIRSLSLHRLYGCSWKLGAAIWSATTILLTSIVPGSTTSNQGEEHEMATDHDEEQQNQSDNTINTPSIYPSIRRD